jgi:hypothetical protein
MTDLDLDRLGDVWRQQPDPAEMELLRRSADAVRRRARWSQLFDVGSAIFVAAVVILLVFSNPQRTTVLMGSAAVLFLLYSNVRTRRIRQIELRSLTGTAENMLDQSSERLEATLKHGRFMLIALGPGVAIGALLAASANISSEGGLFAPLRSSPSLRLLFLVGTIAGLSAMMAYLALSIRRSRRELARLTAMRESYREERKSNVY